jgi:hypothetical protein
MARRSARLALLAPLLLMSCSKEEPAPAGGGAPATAAVDRSSPTKGALALIAACARGDQAAVGACFHPEAAGEFRSLLDGSVAEKEFQGLCAMFQGASVLGAEGDRVQVKLATREESLAMKQDGDAWKVLDF